MPTRRREAGIVSVSARTLKSVRERPAVGAPPLRLGRCTCTTAAPHAPRAVSVSPRGAADAADAADAAGGGCWLLLFVPAGRGTWEVESHGRPQDAPAGWG